MVDRIETRSATIEWGQDAILHIVMASGAEVNCTDVHAITQASIQVRGELKVPVLVDIRGVKSATRDARQAGMENIVVETTTALAIIIGSPLSATIGNLFVKVNKPVYPTRLFPSMEKATTWLKNYPAEKC